MVILKHFSYSEKQPYSEIHLYVLIPLWENQNFVLLWNFTHYKLCVKASCLNWHFLKNTLLNWQSLLPPSLSNLQHILAYCRVCTDFQRKSHYSLCLPGCPPSLLNFNWNWDRNRGCRELNSLLVTKSWFKDESSGTMPTQGVHRVNSTTIIPLLPGCSRWPTSELSTVR